MVEWNGLVEVELEDKLLVFAAKFFAVIILFLQWTSVVMPNYVSYERFWNFQVLTGVYEGMTETVEHFFSLHWGCP